jgi:hypothetical protein
MHRYSAHSRIATNLTLGMTLLFAGPLVGAEDPPQPTPKAAASSSPTANADTKPLERPDERGRRPGDQQKVFVVRNISTRGLASVLKVFPAYVVDGGGGTLAVSASPAVLAAIEETIKRLDVAPLPPLPKKSVEVTVWVLEALARGEPAGKVPAELEGVVTELKRTFNFASYQLADTLVTRGRDGSNFKANSIGSAVGPSAGRIVYNLTGRLRVTSNESQPTIQFDPLSVGAEIPVPTGPKGSDGKYPGWTSRNVGLVSDVDVHEGQRLVIGKSSMGDDDGKGLIFILSVKFVE